MKDSEWYRTENKHQLSSIGSVCHGRSEERENALQPEMIEKGVAAILP